MTDARSFMHARVGGLAKGFWVLWTGTLINRMGTMVVPFMTLYLVGARGLSVPAAGGVMAAYGVGSLVSQVLGGVLADRAGRRATLLGGTVSTAVLMIVLAYARPIPVIVALVLLLGMTIDLYRPAAQSLVADLIPDHDRARAYGLLFWAANLGVAAAPTVYTRWYRISQVQVHAAHVLEASIECSRMTVGGHACGLSTTEVGERSWHTCEVNSEEQLRVLLDDAEDRLQAAVQNGDVAALALLLDDQVLYTGPDGQQATKEQDLQAYASGALQVTDFAQQHRTTRVAGTTGLTWVLADLRGRTADQPFSIRMHYTRTWVHDGTWRVLAAHASLVPSAP